ncbi:glycosyltransferase family 2 protein [Yeosuana marina]|uniref:glycosyltransferase family 2 protein n=1 Tax=Yeosuana marina TaxID=1565536 RepID=UPI0014201663|nr:glycosyltransferase family A protein [Yeosuana marina]
MNEQKQIQVSNNQALVSIIICTYNRASYLNTCISSIIDQTNQQWELIIVDDGSDDNTYNIVNPYLQKYSNIRYVKHKNIKLALSRNVGLLLATGTYITFLDSDDTFKENHIQSRLDFMVENDQVDLIYGGVDLHEDIFVPDFYKPNFLINVKECVLGSTFFGKRSVFFELGGFDNLNYGEDTEFLERASKLFTTQEITHPETYVYTRAIDSITLKKEFENNN